MDELKHKEAVEIKDLPKDFLMENEPEKKDNKTKTEDKKNDEKEIKF